MVLILVWSLLLLQQQKIQCNGTFLGWSLLRIQQQQIQCNVTVLFCSLFWLKQQQIQCNGSVLFMLFIVVTTTLDIVQWYCVVCGNFCGYSISRYSAMLVCCVWSLLWLQQQQLYCIVTVFSVEFIVVTESVDIVQWYCDVCGDYCG